MAVTAVTFKVAVSKLELMTEAQLNNLREHIEYVVGRRVQDLHYTAEWEVTIESISGVLIGDPTN